jgi:hypothetical protein
VGKIIISPVLNLNLKALTYLKDFLNIGHGELLEKGVEGRRAGAPVLSLTVRCVVLLHSVLFLIDRVLDGLSPFIL